MLLAFDTGNSNTVIGLFEGATLLADWRLATDARKTADEYGILCHSLFAQHDLCAEKVERVIISSVVPDLTRTLVEMVERYFHVKPLLVEAGIKTGLQIRYENPKELGADRIVNAVAGIERYGAPLILVDFGSATTFCCVDAQGAYLGGAITAGIGISMEALFNRAAKLPKVELVAPEKVIGRNTVAAMQSGLVYGYAGTVDRMIELLAAEMGYYPHEMTVIGTGGRSDIICPHCRYVDKVDALLTLEGLRILAERNSAREEK